MEQIKISGLNFSYPNSDCIGLKEINLSINKGDFILLFGRSGCGKSTFLKQLKPVIAPFGKLEGSIEFCGKDIKDLSDREQSSTIGFVSQNADNQIVTDKVWHELAFGLAKLFPMTIQWNSSWETVFILPHPTGYLEEYFRMHLHVRM